MAKILLIEDDEGYANILLALLEDDLQHQVQHVDCGLDALTILRMSEFDLIVTDWGLPDMEGPELCKQYRKAGGRTPILMLTGRGEISNKEEGFESGVDDYVTKPCDLKEFALRVKALLRRVNDDAHKARLAGAQAGDGSEDLLGQVLSDKYEIVSLIGMGASGTVYRARHRLLGRDVAIKVMHPHLIADPKSSVRFWQEAKALGSFNHPMIVNVLDFGLTPSGQLYTIVDLLDGASLQVVLAAERCLPITRALRIFVMLADALAYVHQKGIIHRDIKPANIMLVTSEDGREIPKLVDFGLIKSEFDKGNKQSLTQLGELIGSPLYMSPEQCVGQDVDHRTDIFALGCVMYETLSGVVPLSGSTAVETMNLRVFDKPKPFAEACPDVPIPESLERIVFKALAKHSVDRYQSAQEFQCELEMFQAVNGLI
jgi:serine/threonine protein kinase